jgi:hypothetical protein
LENGIRKFKNSLALLLVLVFFLPTIVKIKHHHASPEMNANNATQYHVYHDGCVICEFEFSYFLDDPMEVEFKEKITFPGFFSQYKSPDNSILSQFSILLRAPPVFTMSI